ncbi:flagellar basal-body rod protein FlgG [Aquabacterium sp. OR-4]|uniref:flagellar basal-body rod protein FlgG n=1 Tax=Aquabacterium sp. OR-4 TaxID=2978127 RepID=UPI0021B4CC0C|nr:flagellar basal-body rod protein FlgG [Aquabacterium sp. OR-4]MDT7836190.1 flagellar basal-body rod protein FlgG [Aquabacterium sp. OR-4]
MIRSLWIAKTGMEAQQTQLDAVAHNLANSATNGYKRGHAVFEDLMYQNLRQAGANSTEQTTLPTGLQMGLGVRTVGMARNFSQGSLQQTGNTYDVAINGLGFFPIQMPDGSTGYTRDGAFQLNSQGQMVTNAGYLLQPTITVPQGAQTVTIGSDGVVTASLQGQAAPQQLGQLQLSNFINPAGLEPRGENIYAETAASGAPQVANPNANGMGVLKQQYLENSNVNMVEELVTMIQTQRAYEVNSKAVQTSDQMLQRLGQL